MRVFSFRDLKVIPELSGFTEVELLSPKLDALVLSFLYQLGFSASAPVLYVPNIHRDMQGVVALGFRAVGEITQDREFLKSHMCDPIERLVATAAYDMSLTHELGKLIGGLGVGLRNDFATDEDENFPDELIEPDHDQRVDEITMLELIRDDIRGTPYNEAGKLKMPEEYQ